MTLEVATIAKIAGISEKLTVHTGESLSVIEEAHAIPGRLVLEPPSNIMAEFIIGIDPVVKICTSHGCLYQVVKKVPAQPADTADKWKFPQQGEDSVLGD